MNAPAPDFQNTNPGLAPITPTIFRLARQHVVEQHVREAIAEGWRFTAHGSGFILEPLRGAFYTEINAAIDDVLNDFEVTHEGVEL